jgi:hypothetical protein
MKIVVRVELITDWGEVNTIEVGHIDRPSQTLDPESVGLSLADGKQLLHNFATGGDPSPGGRDLRLTAHLSTMPSLDGVEGLPTTQNRYRVWHGQLPQPTHCVDRP